jgi:hypothetical protein
MEERRTNKEKSSVLGFRIILCIFPMCQSPIGCCKTKLLQMYSIAGFPILDKSNIWRLHYKCSK